MTIHDFFFTAAYLIWFYVLLCLCVKQIWDSWKRVRLRRRMDAVRAFAAGGAQPKHADRSARTIRQLRDNRLFCCVCECLLSALPGKDPAESRHLKACLLRCVHEKIRMTDAHDALTRSLILRQISAGGLTSPEIRHFVQDSRSASPIEQLWIDSMRGETR